MKVGGWGGKGLRAGEPHYPNEAVVYIENLAVFHRRNNDGVRTGEKCFREFFFRKPQRPLYAFLVCYVMCYPAHDRTAYAFCSHSVVVFPDSPLPGLGQNGTYTFNSTV